MQPAVSAFELRVKERSKLLFSYFVIYSFELDDDFTAMYKGQFPFSTIMFLIKVLLCECIKFSSLALSSRCGESSQGFLAVFGTCG